jgi:hypothetical protein
VFSYQMHLRLTLAGAAIVVLSAVAAVPAPAADGVTLEALKPCYVAAGPDQRETIRIVASGFTPGAFVDPYIDDILQPPPPGTAAPQADPAGDVGSDDAPGYVTSPYPETRQRTFTLRLTERAPGNTDHSVQATAKVTRLVVTQTPRTARTASRVRFRGRGFTQPAGAAYAPVYAHYVFAGKDRKTVRVATPYGACGLFSVKLRQFPMKNPRAGTWTIQFDQVRKYNTHPPVSTSLLVTVAPRPHD